MIKALSACGAAASAAELEEWSLSALAVLRAIFGSPCMTADAAAKLDGQTEKLYVGFDIQGQLGVLHESRVQVQIGHTVPERKVVLRFTPKARQRQNTIGRRDCQLGAVGIVSLA